MAMLLMRVVPWTVSLALLATPAAAIDGLAGRLTTWASSVYAKAGGDADAAADRMRQSLENANVSTEGLDSLIRGLVQGASSGSSSSETAQQLLSGLPPEVTQQLGSALSAIGLQNVGDQVSAYGYYQQAVQTVEGIGQSVMAFLRTAETMDYCWSCKVYRSLYEGLYDVVVEMYRFLVESSPELMGLSLVILLFALAFKVLKIIGSPFAGTSSSEWKDLYGFLLRVALVYPAFLTSVTLAGVETDGGGQRLQLFSDVLVNGPMAIGTEIGVRLRAAGCQVLGSGMGAGCGGASTGGAGSDFAAAHVQMAESLLLGFHQIGVSGIAAGTWMATEIPTVQAGAWLVVLATIVAGIVLAFSFFMFTVTFGFRYIDALLRMMVVLSLAPLFFFLWIFRGTQSIALSALRSVFFSATVFAVSGLVFVVSTYIISQAFSASFGGSGAGGMLSADFFARTTGSQIDWMSYFYLLGSCILAQKCAGVVFSIAGELVQFGHGETGLGREMESAVTGTVDSGRRMASRAVGI